jgi:hypothetical protein
MRADRAQQATKLSWLEHDDTIKTFHPVLAHSGSGITSIESAPVCSTSVLTKRAISGSWPGTMNRHGRAHGEMNKTSALFEWR